MIIYSRLEVAAVIVGPVLYKQTKVILTHPSVLPWLRDSKLPQKSTMLLKIYK